MRQIIPKSDFLGKNHGKDVYEMMFDQKVAEEFSSKRGGLGLQKNILTQMERIMGKSKNDQKTLKK
jgi:flagellar protein FlgJ